MAKKRTNGEGHIRQRKNGLWECTIMDGFQPNGKRKYKSFYGNTQSEVKKKMRAYLRAKEEGVILAHEYTFSEWAELWFENHKDNIQSTTQESYRYTLRILESHFGRRKLDQIRAYDIEQFLKQLRQSKASNSRISQCRGMLFQIFNKAVANDLLNKNPAAYADKMRKARPKPKEAFTTREVQLLLEKLPQDKIGWSIRLMLGTGMRTQELLGLEPRHIAEDGSTITIEQAVCMDKGTATLGTPKSFDSYRCIPVPENLRCYAVLLRDAEGKFIWESPRKPGMPCNPSTFRTQFQKAVKGVEGVRVLTPHSCRHPYVKHTTKNIFLQKQKSQATKRAGGLGFLFLL